MAENFDVGLADLYHYLHMIQRRGAEDIRAESAELNNWLVASC